MVRSGVLRRKIIRAPFGAARGNDLGGVERIFDGDGDAVQRAAFFARDFVGLVRFGHRGIVLDLHHRVQRGVHGVYAI